MAKNPKLPEYKGIGGKKRAYSDLFGKLGKYHSQERIADAVADVELAGGDVRTADGYKAVVSGVHKRFHKDNPGHT